MASLNTIFAVTQPGRGARGISAIVVEKDTPGYRVGKHEDKMGIRCVPVVEIHFEDCRVPPGTCSAAARAAGFKQAMMTLDRARPGVAAQAVGLAQGAFDLAVEYTSNRKQFGQSISAFQGIQWMLADMADPDRGGPSAGPHRGPGGRCGSEEHQEAVGHVQADGHRRGHEGHHRRASSSSAATAMSRTTRSRSTCATPRSRRSTRAPTRSRRLVIARHILREAASRAG